MNILNRYIWLIDTLLQAGKKGLTFEQINTKYRYNDAISEGGEYSIRTFHNHRNEISELFGIEILCDKSDYRYYINDTDELKGTSIFRRWLLQSVSVNNVVASTPRIRNQIILEDIPSSETFLTVWLTALKESRRVSFDYHPYWLDETVHYDYFVPYAVRMYQRRWYVLGEDGHHSNVPNWENRCRLYALDRMEQVELLEDTYALPIDCDPQRLLHGGLYGLYIDPTREMEIIKLKVDAVFANYMRSLPLHHSQKESDRNSEYSLFYLLVKPSPDLERDILAHCDSIEVLQPIWLRVKIEERLKAAAAKYQ